MTSLAIGPANFAGQADAWARAVRDQLDVDARSFAYGRLPGRPGAPKFGHSSDVGLPPPRVPEWPIRRLAAWRALRGADRVALDGFLTISGRVGVDTVAADVRALQNRGTHVALVAHGSDVRDPDLHMDLTVDSYFHSAPPDWVEAARQRSRRNRAVAAEHGGPLFVSTPDLLNDLPTATWLPLTVDLSRIPYVERQTHRRPRVLHLPSRSYPPIKGTEVIEAALQRLSDAGAIEWVRRRPMPHADLLDLLPTVDIVVDQILGGSYGVTTIEAMAAGCLVVGNIGPHTTSHMPAPPPVIQSTPELFLDTLESVATAFGAPVEHSSRGRDFVREWHDGRAAAQALKTFLL